MSRTLLQIRAELDKIISDDFSSTTTAGGAADKKSMVDVSLAEYEDGNFEGYFCYIPSVVEERRVDDSLSPSGTLTFTYAWSAQVATATAYELHRYRLSRKNNAINTALTDCYPQLYKPVVKEMYSQYGYGVTTNEFDKRYYAISASDFELFPFEVWKREGYGGLHTGTEGDAALTSSGASWKTDELVGLTLHNKTDGSTGTVTGNTATVVTATLSGGTNDDWSVDDEFLVAKPDRAMIQVTNYQLRRNPAGSYEMYLTGVAENYLVFLSGITYLSSLSSDSDTTEVTEGQAKIVAQKAAVNLYRRLSMENAGRVAKDLAESAERLYVDFRIAMALNAMPPISAKVRANWDWIK